VPAGFPRGGLIAPGDVLVSNFNNVTNTQGTGTTIVKLALNGAIAPSVPPMTMPGNAATFFQGANTYMGLTTALGVLQGGFVIIGNVPNVGGSAQQGALQFLDRNGTVARVLTDPTLLDGPWDLTVKDDGNYAQILSRMC